MTRPTAIRLLGIAAILALSTCAGRGLAETPVASAPGLTIQSTVLGATGIISVVIGLVKVIGDVMRNQRAAEHEVHELAMAKAAASKAEVEERVRREQAAEAARLAALQADAPTEDMPMERVADKRLLRAVHVAVEGILPDVLGRAKAAGAAGAVQAATAARAEAEKRADEQHSRVNTRAEALRADLTRDIVKVEAKVDKNTDSVHALEASTAGLRVLLEEIKGLVNAQNAAIAALDRRVTDLRSDMRPD